MQWGVVHFLILGIFFSAQMVYGCPDHEGQNLLKRLAQLAKKNSLETEFEHIVAQRIHQCHTDPSTRPDSFQLSDSVLSLLRSIAKTKKNKKNREDLLFEIDKLYDGNGRPVNVDLSTGVATINYDFELWGKNIRIHEVFTQDDATELIALGRLESRYASLENSEQRFGIRIPGREIAQRVVRGQKPKSREYRKAIRGDLTLFLTNKLPGRNSFITSSVRSNSPIQDFLEQKILGEKEPGISFQVEISTKRDSGSYVTFLVDRTIKAGGESVDSVKFSRAWGDTRGTSQSLALGVTDTLDLSLDYSRDTLDQNGRLRGLALDATQDGAGVTFYKQLNPTVTLVGRGQNYDGEEVFEAVANVFGSVGIGLKKKGGDDAKLNITTDFKW